MATEPGDIDGIKDAFGEYEKLIPTLKNISDNIGSLFDQINSVNKAFGEGRLRATEFSNAISDSVAGVIRVGGEVEDISRTIIDIAAGARRNIVATTETIVQLTAASKALGDFNIETITNNFMEAGIAIANIAENIEDSILYVQSIGLNAETVMSDVIRNMENMNRFNFSEGVVGFTKMAAQASMLRFDMQTTKTFADKVLNPQGAIEMASAFQRLGVMTGSLVDPFTLMEKSINDPKGLQDSLIELTKQFTFFDEKTNSFKINPGGIRMMKELEDSTGISFQQMSQTALAAADLERRLSEINFDIDASDEDKTLVANMAKMGAGGEYFVELQNKSGTLEQKKLTDLTQTEFERLREIQETRPKTIEDISRSQLGTLNMIERDIKALPIQLAYSLAGQDGIVRLAEAARRLSDTTIGSAYDPGKLPSGREMRELFQGVGDSLKNIIMEAAQGDTDALSTAYGTLMSDKIPESIKERLTTYLDGLNFEGGVRSPEEQGAQTYLLDNLQKLRGLTGSEDNTTTSTKNNNVNFGGSFTIKVEGSQGLDTKSLSDYVNTETFKQKMTMVIQEEMKKQNKPIR